MVIQGTQVPMYTNTHYFCIFFFNFFIFIFIWKTKQTKTIKKINKNKLNKEMHKTKLTQNNKAKHTSNAKQKYERERKNKQWNHLEPFFFHTLEKLFRLANPWSGGEGEELKPFKFERNMRALRRSSRGAKEDGN